MKPRNGSDKLNLENSPLTLISSFLQPLDQNEFLVTHLKDPNLICFEPESQGHGHDF